MSRLGNLGALGHLGVPTRVPGFGPNFPNLVEYFLEFKSNKIRKNFPINAQKKN